MTDSLVPAGDGHTPLSDDDLQGLRLTYIATRGELFDAEQRNIAEALARRRPPTAAQLLDDKYLRDLHKAMLGQVWRWAGQYRRRDTNIGVDWTAIATEVRKLAADAAAWVEHATFEPDELAVRFHHRLVFIHPFPNGNGRHGRVAADYLARALGRPAFSWGARLDVLTEDLRAAYRRALQQADAGSYDELLVFARA